MIGDPVYTVSMEQIIGIDESVGLGSEIVLFDSDFLFSYDGNIPLRFGVFIVMICVCGGGRIRIDLKEYEYSSGSLIMLSPDNYLNSFKPSDDCRFKVLVCSGEIFRSVLPRLKNMFPFMVAIQSQHVFPLLSDEADALIESFDFIRKKLMAPESVFRTDKIVCMSKAFFFELLEMCAGKEDFMPSGRKEEIMASFIVEVSSHFKVNREVAFYADRLSITPKHLSSVVKEVSGYTAGEWIEKYVVMEAKILLRSTDLPIQAIASRLNFANQSFFGKYFRKIVGVSPSAFRKNGE